MKITPISLNYIQNAPKKSANYSLHMNNALHQDTVSFSGIFDVFKKEEKPKKTLGSLVPAHRGIIYKKVMDEDGKVVEKVPVEVRILKSEDDTFDFIHNGEIVGYVKLSYCPKEICKRSSYYETLKNYRREGVKGERIIVDMVKNRKQDEYGGIGHLADLIEVAVCKEMGVEPNIISHSRKEAAPLHYLRGKRFIPYERYCRRSFMRHQGLKGKNPNDTIKEIIENTPKGEKFNTNEIPFAPLMYMPKSMAKELEKELEEHPIF